MNTPTTPQPTPDLEALRKAIQAFRPDSQRVPFSNLKPLHDSIAELRGKQASYSMIAELLRQHGVKTSRARVAEYGRIVLEGGKTRRRRKRPHTSTPAANIPVALQTALAANQPATPSVAPTAANAVPLPPSERSPYTSRGPRIARIRMADGRILGENTPRFDAVKSSLP